VFTPEYFSTECICSTEVDPQNWAILPNMKKRFRGSAELEKRKQLICLVAYDLEVLAHSEQALGYFWQVVW
jgi:hypothetical protein